MAKRKNKIGLWILLSILAIAIFLITLWQFGSFDTLFSTLLIGSGTEEDIFFCQDDDFTANGYCNVVGTMYCDTAEQNQGENVVIARTDNVDFSSGWFAYSPIYGDSRVGALQSYIAQGTYHDATGIIDTLVSDAFLRDVLFDETTGNLYIYRGPPTRETICGPCYDYPDNYPSFPSCPSGSSRIDAYVNYHCNLYRDEQGCSVCEEDEFYKYILGDGANTGSEPQYGCQTLEVCSEGSSQPYSCSGFFEIKDLNNNPLINPEPLLCSSNNPCSDSFVYNNIPQGYIVTVTGGDRNEITYQKYNIPECSRDTCEGNFVRECINGMFGDLIPCDYGCLNGECIDPYDVEITIQDARGFERNSFNKNEQVNVIVIITTQSQFSGDLTLDIREGSPQGNSVSTIPITFQANTPYLFDFSSPITGVYYIVLSIQSEFGTDYYGIEPEELTSFEIVDEFTANLRLTQTLGGVDTSNKFYAGYPIKIEYIFKEPGDTPILPDSALVTYQIGYGSRIELLNPEISQDDFAGYYTYYLLPTQSGTYKFEGIATKGTFTTNPSVKGPYAIERDSISITSNLEFNPVQVNKFYTDILKFETRNRDKQLIETINTVKVKINGVDSGTVPVKGSGGEYSIDYTFTQDNADYLFTIESTDGQGILVQGELDTELIKSGQEEDFSCMDDSECETFEKCVSGNCETNVFLIISLFLGVGIFILIVVLIFVFIRNKRKQPKFGLEGY